MKVTSFNSPQPVASSPVASARPLEAAPGDTFQSGDYCPYNPWSIKPMSLGERVATTAGLGTAGALSGLFGGLMTMSNASQLSALPYFALAGGLAGCALAAVAIIGEG